MEVNSSLKDGVVSLEIKGRIDTTTSPALQNELMKAFQKADQVVLDFTEVEYISSAGLRILLLGHKTAEAKNGSMKIIHVEKSVMNVLQMTGFSNFLEIES